MATTIKYEQPNPWNCANPTYPKNFASATSFTALQPPPAPPVAAFNTSVPITQDLMLTALLEVGYGPEMNFGQVFLMQQNQINDFAQYLLHRATTLANAVEYAAGDVFTPEWSDLIESSELNPQSYFYGMAGAYVATTTWLPGAQLFHVSTFQSALVSAGHKIAAVAASNTRECPDLFARSGVTWHLVEGKGRSFLPTHSGKATPVIKKALTQLDAIIGIGSVGAAPVPPLTRTVVLTRMFGYSKNAPKAWSLLVVDPPRGANAPAEGSDEPLTVFLDPDVAALSLAALQMRMLSAQPDGRLSRDVSFNPVEFAQRQKRYERLDVVGLLSTYYSVLAALGDRTSTERASAAVLIANHARNYCRVSTRKALSQRLASPSAEVPKRLDRLQLRVFLNHALDLAAICEQSTARRDADHTQPMLTCGVTLFSPDNGPSGMQGNGSHGSGPAGSAPTPRKPSVGGVSPARKRRLAQEVVRTAAEGPDRLAGVPFSKLSDAVKPNARRSRAAGKKRASAQVRSPVADD